MGLDEYGGRLRPMVRTVGAPGPGEALVRIRFCGVCRSDFKLSRGQLPFSRDVPLPHVLGHDAAGEVAAVGPGVSLDIGTKVVVYNYDACRTCPTCLRGDENNCAELRVWFGFRHPGGFQEYAIVGAHRLVPVPPGLDLVAAATLSCGLATSYRAVITRGAVRPGECVAVVGCGGLGLHAIQLAVHAGAEVVAVDVSPAAREAALRWGAQRAVDPAVLGAIDSDGALAADAVIEFSGAAASHALVASMLKPGGRVVAVGYEADAKVAGPLPHLVLSELQVLGSRYARRDEYVRAMQLLASGAVRAVIDTVYPLEEANTALDRFGSGSPLGRIVLEVSPNGFTSPAAPTPVRHRSRTADVPGPAPTASGDAHD